MTENILDGKIIAVDFDSTVSHYNGWRGVGVFGQQIKSVAWALGQFKKLGAIVVIWTCRRETNLVTKYLEENRIPFDYVNFSPRNKEFKLSPKKIAADIYIDDKAINFSGEWKDTYLQVVNFKRWEAKHGGAAIRS